MSHFSQQDTLGMSEKYIMDNLPHTKCCANCCRAYADGEDTAFAFKWLKIHWEGYSKYGSVTGARNIPTVRRVQVSFIN